MLALLGAGDRVVWPCHRKHNDLVRKGQYDQIGGKWQLVDESTQGPEVGGDLPAAGRGEGALSDSGRGSVVRSSRGGVVEQPVTSEEMGELPRARLREKRQTGFSGMWDALKTSKLQSGGNEKELSRHLAARKNWEGAPVGVRGRSGGCLRSLGQS